MVTKPAEKIIDALTQLMEGYGELQEAVEEDYSSEPSDDTEDSPDVNSEVDAAIITEMRAAIEAVMDTEDYAPEELASLISSLTEALEEIDPDVFESAVETEEVEYEDAEEDEEYYDDTDEEFDEDDDFDEYDEDEEEDDEDEEEEEDDEYEDDEDDD